MEVRIPGNGMTHTHPTRTPRGHHDPGLKELLSLVGVTDLDRGREGGREGARESKDLNKSYQQCHLLRPQKTSKTPPKTPVITGP